MSLFGRIRDLLAPPPTTVERASAPAEPGRKRRRGKRGGRGRGRRNDAQQQEGTTTTQTLPDSRPRSTPQTSSDSRDRGDRRRSDRERSERDRNDRGRNDRDRSGRNDRRRPDRGRPRRRNLDEPLPEDVAFRPAAEGGDNTILPGRRRRPPGPRTTPRVWVSGQRNLPVLGNGDTPTTADTVEEPLGQAEETPTTTAPTDRSVSDEAATDPTSDAIPASRRRRGRRGGRGRNRASDANGAAPATADDAEADEAEADKAKAEVVDEPVHDSSPEPDPERLIDVADAPEAFRALGISDRSLTMVMEMGFTEPTPVQERAIPVLLEGYDVVGIAQTGTGKTLAFGLPMAERLDPSRAEAQALVLVPTRELAQQVLAVLTDLGRPFGLRTVGLLGGHALQGDFRALDAHPHVIVGTPGRIKDHLRRRTLSLSAIRYAVLDEADQMLDIGFLPDITHILGRTPRSRQTALFSATMPHNVMRLVRRYMDQPETIAVAAELATVESVDHVYFEVAERDKVRGLRELIDRELRGRTLVFSRTKRGVDRLAERLYGLGVKVGALHGDMDQRKRDRVVQSFRDGELDLLIATNVAARGLDIPEITHVVNFDAADNAEEYVHRTGRTGRAGREGKAISFVSEVDIARFDVLRETFGERLTRDRLDMYA